MSGHSRWAGIKHKKAIVDKKKGKMFTKVTREITMAAKLSGGNPESNPRLRKAIEDARAVNMPQDNIKRAIQKGTGELPGATIEEVTYEGYGCGGAAVFIKGTTDNRNRTTSEIRKIFSEHGGNMGDSGCVAWIFEPKGYITISKGSISEDKLMNMAIEVGAEDVKSDDDDVFEVTTTPAEFDAVKQKLVTQKVKIDSAELTMLPKNLVPIKGDDATRCLELMDELEEHDDVASAYSNFDIPKEIINKS